MHSFEQSFRQMSDEILRHPLFAQARLSYVEGILALYEADRSLVELMRDGGRIMVYGVVLCLWGQFQEEDRASWPTVKRLKTELLPFDLVSDRQIDHIVSRLTDLGFIELQPSAQDSRVRLVLPTAMLRDHDRDWLRAHYVPLACLHGPEAYAFALARDAGFHRDLRAGSLPLLPHIAKNIVTQNRPMMRVLNRAVGMLTLMKLVQHIARHSMPAVTYSGIGEQFGVSRTHVREIVSSAAEDGNVVVQKGGYLRLLPPMLAGFDRLIADGMVVSMLAYRAALERYFGGSPSLASGQPGAPAS